jgi:hypothetical protein
MATTQRSLFGAKTDLSLEHVGNRLRLGHRCLRQRLRGGRHSPDPVISPDFSSIFTRVSRLQCLASRRRLRAAPPSASAAVASETRARPPARAPASPLEV